MALERRDPGRDLCARRRDRDPDREPADDVSDRRLGRGVAAMTLARSGLEARSDSSGRDFPGKDVGAWLVSWKGARFRACCVADQVRLWAVPLVGLPFGCGCDVAW